MSVEERRREFLAGIPRWYSGWAHFVLIHVICGGVIAGCVYMLDDPTWPQWMFVPGFFVFANWFEWWIHRGPMHHKTRLLPLVYRRHTLEHHAVFTHDKMGLEADREMYFVLFTWWFLPMILTINAPIPILLGLFVSANMGYLFLLSALAYYLVYEWFHLLHHVPAETWVGRRRLVSWLRRHHQDHHDQGRMTQGNFNVSFPLWDYLLGSVLPRRS